MEKVNVVAVQFLSGIVIQALEEAEKYRGIMGEGNIKEQDLADAQNLYNARREAASEAERCVLC